jgi:hypothetical protein
MRPTKPRLKEAHWEAGWDWKVLVEDREVEVRMHRSRRRIGIGIGILGVRAYHPVQIPNRDICGFLCIKCMVLERMR